MLEVLNRYLDNGNDFVDERLIFDSLKAAKGDDRQVVRDIIQKSLCVETLELKEAAYLLNVDDEDSWNEIFAAAAEIKRRVYDNRVVTFAPLYCGNYCSNNCLYCGFRRENTVIKRRQLNMDEVRKEAEVLAGKLGHKRVILVSGEHPGSGAEYIAEAMKVIYGVKVKVGKACGEIRRINVNAAPMSAEDLKKIKSAGIGTYQVFQETYHHETYSHVHPRGSLKNDYLWRLYSLHRAMEAGIDDVAIGALLGLYDWRFEVLGLLLHARDLEKHFGIGPHTVSFPRLEPAANTPFIEQTRYKVSDDDFRKLVAVVRLAIPYAGLIVTCREKAELIRRVIPMCTQRDASSRIGIGAYSDRYDQQQGERQQFILGDTRTLDEVIRELAAMGYITSFCTAGYRCGRTGDNIMGMLKSGKEGCLCKLNAVLTFQEWLQDFATSETKRVGEEIVKKEMREIESRVGSSFSPEMYSRFLEYYGKIIKGERDLCF